jgi:DNA-binding NarL/FixJ family response regulator
MREVGSPPIRVLLVDDQALVRAGVRHLLEAEADIAVVWEVGEAKAALCRAGLVDVVVTELALPDRGGVALIAALKGQAEAPGVVVLTADDAAARIRAALEVGTDGYVLKQGPPAELAAAVRAAARGETHLGGPVARRLAQAVCQPQERATDHLTGREREVLAQVAAGATSKEVARRLGLSPKTIENHRGRILEKLGVATTGAAVIVALREGLLDLAAS